MLVILLSPDRLARCGKAYGQLFAAKYGNGLEVGAGVLSLLALLLTTGTVVE
jgi:hypothetical protein